MSGWINIGGSNIPSQPANRSNNPNANSVQRTRAWSGFWVVFFGDLAIAAAAFVAVWKLGNSSGNSPVVAILTSAFTAIATMTTAYFGIKTMSNTAQSFAPGGHHPVQPIRSGADGDDGGPGRQPDEGGGNGDYVEPDAGEIVTGIILPDGP